MYRVFRSILFRTIMYFIWNLLAVLHSWIFNFCCHSFDTVIMVCCLLLFVLLGAPKKKPEKIMDPLHPKFKRPSQKRTGKAQPVEITGVKQTINHSIDALLLFFIFIMICAVVTIALVKLLISFVLAGNVGYYNVFFCCFCYLLLMCTT